MRNEDAGASGGETAAMEVCQRSGRERRWSEERERERNQVHERRATGFSEVDEAGSWRSEGDGILNGPINGGGAPIGCSGCMRAQLDIEKTAVAGSLHQLHIALASFDEYVSSNWNEK